MTPASPHISIAIDTTARILRVVRSTVPLADLGAVRDLVAHVQRLLAPLNRSRYVLLFDLRHALLVEESTFATALAALRKEVVSGFRKAALLVQTKMGALQVSRFLREEGLVGKVFDDERAAEEWLRSDT